MTTSRLFYLTLLSLTLAPSFASAQKPRLRWGTDPTGGAPYVYRNEKGDFVGFEVELAEYLARELGRESVMVAGDWDKLPLLLDKPASDPDSVDIVLNGYEFRGDLEKQYPSTIPYYIYRLGLVIHQDDAAAVASWPDLKRKNGVERRSVGVLGGSAAHGFIKDEFGELVDLRINQDVATVISLVEQHRLDATVQDLPAARYYVEHGNGLAIADESRNSGFYVILTRPSDVELREQLNRALKKAICDGILKRIYEKYDLWNADQERLYYWSEQPWPPVVEEGKVKNSSTATHMSWGNMILELIRAAGMTIFLSITSFPLAMVIGLLVALGRVYAIRPIAIVFGLYVEFLRGTPLLLQMYFIYYLIPQAIPVLSLTPLQAGIIALAINYSAYEAENYRAGLLAVPRGQMEAALALGLTPYTAIRIVIVPQAIRMVIPPVTNDFIALFKDTSVCSVILITELTRKYNELYNFNREFIVELAIITAGLYLLMSYPLALAAGWLERRVTLQPGGVAR